MLQKYLSVSIGVIILIITIAFPVSADILYTTVPSYDQQRLDFDLDGFYEDPPGVCAEFSIAMVFGYYDNNGWKRFVPYGSASALENPRGVYELVNTIISQVGSGGEGMTFDDYSTRLNINALSRMMDPSADFTADFSSELEDVEITWDLIKSSLMTHGPGNLCILYDFEYYDNQGTIGQAQNHVMVTIGFKENFSQFGVPANWVLLKSTWDNGDEGLDPLWINWDDIDQFENYLGYLHFYEGGLPSSSNDTTDDDYEDDDYRTQASQISSPFNASMSCNDSDWFEISLEQGDKIDGRISFAHSNGNLDLYLYDFLGRELAKSETNLNEEKLSHVASLAGKYYILVKGRDFDQNTYNISITKVRATYAISGYVRTSSGAGINGVTVTFNNGGGAATTDALGFYTCTVSYGWSGSATPSLSGYTFTPGFLLYINVTTNKSSQNYIGRPPADPMISGYVRTSGGSSMNGVTVAFSGGGGTATTSSSGYYSRTVSYGWSGSATPSLSGFTFSPASLSYMNVATSLSNQNFTGTASNAGLTVTLLPAAAASAGAQWNVDRGPWHNSGATVSGLSVGSHTVNYKAVSGWTAPSSETVTLTSGQTTTVTRNYTLQGTVPLGDAVDASNLTWTTGGDNNWFGQTQVTRDGVGAAQSGGIAHNQQTWMEITVEGPGTISFYWQVSSQFNYDFLRFYIGSSAQASLSGNVGWQHQSFSVPQGRQTLRWSYSKDNSVNAGSDCGWVDNVVYRCGVCKDELVLNFGPDYGLYQYDKAGGWNQWNTVYPSQMVTVDFNGDGMDELVAAFPGYGLYKKDSPNDWKPINNVDPAKMIATDIDGDGKDELVAAFIGYGLYYYDDLGGWSPPINTVIPDAMVRFSEGVVCDFGAAYGLWSYNTSGGWSPLNAEDPDKIVATDIDGDGKDELVVSFEGWGLYIYEPVGGTWQQINTVVPDEILAVDIDNNGVEELVVSFPGYGLWYYNETNGWQFLNDVVPDDMKPINFYP